MKITNIEIKKTTDENKVLAYAKVTLNDCFVVHNIRILNVNDKTFIAMPSIRKDDGFHDICHPITTEFRNKLTQKILGEYKKGE